MNATSLAATGIALLLLVGCDSLTDSTGSPSLNAPAAKTKTTVPAQAFAALHKGLTTAQVRELVGEPVEIRPFRTGELSSEVWVCRHLVSKNVQSVVLGSRDIPATNPTTGQAITVQEPIYSYEQTTVTEDIELLMYDGKVVELKRKPHVERSITP